MMLLHKKDDSLPEPQSDKYPKGCLWVGHLAPDTDSYCTAMAAAEIFEFVSCSKRMLLLLAHTSLSFSNKVGFILFQRLLIGRHSSLWSALVFQLPLFSLTNTTSISFFPSRFSSFFFFSFLLVIFHALVLLTTTKSPSPLSNIMIFPEKSWQVIPFSFLLSQFPLLILFFFFFFFFLVIIDHHAVQSETMTVESIIHIDVRPWGSTSTLLYETYLVCIQFTAFFLLLSHFISPVFLSKPKSRCCSMYVVSHLV